MKAAVLETQGEPLAIREDVEIEDPRAGQVRVRIASGGICHSDLSVIDGSFPAPLPNATASGGQSLKRRAWSASGPPNAVRPTCGPAT